MCQKEQNRNVGGMDRTKRRTSSLFNSTNQTGSKGWTGGETARSWSHPLLSPWVSSHPPEAPRGRFCEGDSAVLLRRSIALNQEMSTEGLVSDSLGGREVHIYASDHPWLCSFASADIITLGRICGFIEIVKTSSFFLTRSRGTVQLDYFHRPLVWTVKMVATLQ